MLTGPNSGIIETITDAISIDSLKKNIPNFYKFSRFFSSNIIIK